MFYVYVSPDSWSGSYFFKSQARLLIFQILGWVSYSHVLEKETKCTYMCEMCVVMCEIKKISKYRLYLRCIGGNNKFLYQKFNSAHQLGVALDFHFATSCPYIKKIISKVVIAPSLTKYFPKMEN